MAKYNMSESRSSNNKSYCFVTGKNGELESKNNSRLSLRSSSEKSAPHPCLACNVDGATDLASCQHSMDSCVAWGSLTYNQRVAKVQCIKHPFRNDHSTKECKTPLNRKCRFCDKENDHHFLLCERFQVKRIGASNLASLVGCAKVRTEHEDCLPNLPPVMLYTTFVKTEFGYKLGSLIDNGSTDDYITHKAARKLNLIGYPIDLTTEGFGGAEIHVKTYVYQVPIFDKLGGRHILYCYGTDKITNGSSPPDKQSYQRLCNKFAVQPKEVKRPNHIELLISLRSSFLHPTDSNSKSIDGMTLASGPLGKVFGGWDRELRFSPHNVCCHVQGTPASSASLFKATTMHALVRNATYTTPLKTDREILHFFDEEQIGVQSSPKCGNCQCGSCIIGNRNISIKDELEYAKFKSLMHLDIAGSEADPGPYWTTKFPWTLNPEELINNKRAVTALMHSTERKLLKNDEWRAIFEQQLRVLIEKGFAKEISETDISAWENSGGTVYFIAHQIVVNPQNKTTPVRVCFNSSQVYAGYSLNTSWELGPNLINSLHAILLRFRGDLVGGQGDVTKMYYMVRIAEEETWKQIWMWRFTGENKIRYFKMTRLVMGNVSSPGLSGVALSGTAKLEDFPIRYPSAHQALTEDTYVDNVLITASSKNLIKQKIREIEFVSAKGGFYFKPWIVSGENLPDQIVGLVLPDAASSEEEKALGTYWAVRDDTFYVKADLIKPAKKVRRGVNETVIAVNEDMSVSITPHLTLRFCLSMHARPFDPLGLVLPVKMRGNILFRISLQSLKKEKRGKIPWDESLPCQLKDLWVKYFEMLLKLEDIKFPRSYKPENFDPSVRPSLITFNDGNPEAYGSVAYARWKLLDSSYVTRLIMAKARLGPLTHMGETVRNELSGATLSARITTWIQKNSGVRFENAIHFLDSRIVRDMLDKDSYLFTTFFGLRVAEIQQKTVIENWLHIASGLNVADLLTKGCLPTELGPGSMWQCGPSFLTNIPHAEWPVSPRPDREPKQSRNDLAPFFRKTKILTVSTCADVDAIDLLVAKCSNLEKLLRIVALIRRVHLSSRSQRTGGETTGVSVRPITASERDDAWKAIIAWDQRKRLQIKNIQRLVPNEVEVQLSNCSHPVSHIVITGRVKNFPITFSGHDGHIPIIPHSNLAKLIVQFYHDKYHVEVDTIVSHVRQDCWVLHCRKIASSVDDKCKVCKLKRKATLTQVMGDLPDFRAQILPAFTVVGCDLFGPLLIKDDVVKRGARVNKKVWGVLFSCSSTRAIYLDVACGYSTEELLHTVRRAMARHGDIKRIISDPGTQMVGCARELSAWRSGWDTESLARFGAEKGLEWYFVSASAQHQNRFTEVMIKLAKGVMKSLMTVLRDTVLNLNELNTLLCETAQIVNERPIGIQPNESVDSIYLSPASLLLGRCSSRISSGPFRPNGEQVDDPKAFGNRFLMVQAITQQFWNVWQKLYFPTLVIRQKWHSERRNVTQGDVVLVKDSNMLRGEWRIGRVSECYPDSKGRVRNVEIIVKPQQGGSREYVPTASIPIRRHVGSVIVLVPIEEC